MFRRLAIVLAAAASLLMVASPASAAQTYTARQSGLAIDAVFTNLPVDAETYPPGDYFVTWVWGASELGSDLLEHEAQDVCAFREGFTITDEGEWIDWTFVGGCGEAQTLTIDRQLATGRLVASFPVTDCAAWDEETGECLEIIELGTLSIDLTLTGTGQVQRYRSVSAGGVAGLYSSVFHGTGALRTASVGGDITLDGASLIAGATYSDAQMVKTKTGYVEVSIGE